MRTNTDLLKCLVFVLIIFFSVCDCKRKGVGTRVKKKLDANYVQGNNLIDKGRSNHNATQGNKRGFLPYVGLFTLGKVLNFFPVGGERECQSSGATIARAGICLNPYDCRQRDGKAAGDCAHGLGVCCVFEVSCGGTVQNNLTYFISPRFPELWNGGKDCSITIEKTHAGITQLKIDFIHFTIGQPNRATGECDEDAMVIGEGKHNFTLCGQNHGQHLYYTLPESGERAREAGDLPTSRGVKLRVTTRGDAVRVWLMRIAQLPLAAAAPHNCLQYFTDNNGTIKTFNYATNGRHLAGHEYKSCVRRNVGFCSIRYMPCNSRSFRIGSGGGDPQTTPGVTGLGPGALGGSGTGFYGPHGEFLPTQTPSTTLPTTTEAVDEQSVSPNVTNGIQQDGMMPVVPVDDAQTQTDETEGSGADPNIASPMDVSTPQVVSTTTPSPSIAARIWSFIWPSWIWGQSATTSRMFWTRWSPYSQYYKTKDDDEFRYNGYGNFGVGLLGYGRQRCRDRITIPCENEYFISSSSIGPGVCDPHHCGSTFCPGAKADDCHTETSITPFAVSIHFGPPTEKENPEDNIGACLRYTQSPCNS